MVPGGAEAPQSQTLDRGIRILELLSDAGEARSVAALAESLGVHRSITYRLLRTLESHGLVQRDARGAFTLGLGIVALSRTVRPELQAAATPVLGGLAEEVGMTAFLVVRAGDEALTVVSVEPRTSATHVAYRPGTRHPVGRGAPGLALLVPEPASAADRAELRTARERGWAYSQGEVVTGLRSVAAPVVGADGRLRAAVGVVFVGDDRDLAFLGSAVQVAAKAIGVQLA